MIFKFETNDFLRDGIGCEDTKVRAERAAELAQLALEKHLEKLPKVFARLSSPNQIVEWSICPIKSSNRQIVVEKALAEIEGKLK